MNAIFFRQEFDRLQIFQLPGDVTATFNSLHNSLTTTTSVSQKKHHIPIPELINTNMMFLEFRLPFTAEFLTGALQFQNLCFFFEDFRGVPQVKNTIRGSKYDYMSTAVSFKSNVLVLQLIDNSLLLHNCAENFSDLLLHL